MNDVFVAHGRFWYCHFLAHIEDLIVMARLFCTTGGYFFDCLFFCVCVCLFCIALVCCCCCCCCCCCFSYGILSKNGKKFVMNFMVGELPLITACISDYDQFSMTVAILLFLLLLFIDPFTDVALRS